MITRRRGGGRGLLFFVYLILGLYFLNFGLNFVTIPPSFVPISNWIVFVGGIFLIFSAIKHLMARRYYR